MNKRHLAVAAGVLALVTGGVAYSAGNWSTLPQVGEPSFCVSTVSGTASPSNSPYLQPPGSTQGTGSSICAQTVPAGPVGLTGNEIIPADTQLSNSTPPQTVTIPVLLFDSGAFNYVQGYSTLLSGTDVVIPNNTNVELLDPSVTVGTLSVTLPALPLNGQMVRLASTHTITSLLMIAPGTTINNSPTALTVSTTGAYNYDFIYDSPLLTWFRVQ